MIREGFFLEEDLCQCSFATRLLFVGLWLLADREGKLEDKPKRIGVQIFPYEHHELNIDAMLSELAKNNFIMRYTYGDQQLILIKNFIKHQNIHPKEAQSSYPFPLDFVPPKAPERRKYEKKNSHLEGIVAQVAAQRDLEKAIRRKQ